LGDVSGVLRITEHSKDEIHDGTLVPSHEFVKSGVVTRLNLPDKLGIWLFVKLHVDLKRTKETPRAGWLVSDQESMRQQIRRGNRGRQRARPGD
jgi:hypothetical protein